MKTPLLITAWLLFGGIASAPAENPAAPAGPTPAPPASTPPVSLEKAMKKLAGAYKELASDLQSPQDAEKADYLTLAATIKEAADQSGAFDPKAIQVLPPEQQAAFVADYKKALVAFDAKVDVLTQALTAGDWPAARQAMEGLKEAMKAGHHTYMKAKDGTVGWTPQAPSPASTSAASTPPAG